VPPRRRRAGYRPGHLSEVLRAVISEEAARLGELKAAEDPATTIEAVGDVFAALDDELAALVLPRLRAVAALRRQGWSYDRIVAATSLSKSRVAQLAREARERDL
jgi:hypothetical protein